MIEKEYNERQTSQSQDDTIIMKMKTVIPIVN